MFFSTYTADNSSLASQKDSIELPKRVHIRNPDITCFQQNEALPLPAPFERVMQPLARPSRKGTFLSRVEHLGKQTLPLLPGHLALFFSIALVFAGICFTSCIGQLGEPAAPFTEGEVRLDLGVASMLFIIVIKIAVYAALWITPLGGRHGTAAKAFTAHHSDTETGSVLDLMVSDEFRTQRLLAVLTVLATELLLLTAFIFVFLAVMAYAQEVGIAGVSIFGVALVKTVVCWTYKFVGTD